MLFEGQLSNTGQQAGTIAVFGVLKVFSTLNCYRPVCAGVSAETVCLGAVGASAANGKLATNVSNLLWAETLAIAAMQAQVQLRCCFKLFHGVCRS